MIFKKDLKKILSSTISTYLILLVGVFILKLFGLNYFEPDINNEIIVDINNFITHWKLEYIWYAVTLYINVYITLSISCNDNSKRMKIYTLCALPISIFAQYLKTKINLPYLFVLTDLLYLFILSICYIRFVKRNKVQKVNIINYFVFTICTILIQFISLITRNVDITNNTNFIVYIILNIDYFILLLLSYKLYFIKGGNNLWVEVHYSFSVLLTSLKRLPEKLRKSYNLAKPRNREDELTNKIYVTLFWLYNIFTLIVVLFIAKLNHAFIEAIFITSSFWMNKGTFGKPLHFRKASTCFIVSSLSYYIITRLTWESRLTFFVPISLGIALAYITTKIMESYRVPYLYKGMSENDFYQVITKATDNKEHIDICKRYYVDKMSNLKIAMEFHYSEPNIKKIKQKINKKINELYK